MDAAGNTRVCTITIGSITDHCSEKKVYQTILLYWLLWQVTTNRSTNQWMERRKQNGEESILTVFLNGDEDRELVSARSDAKLAGDDRYSVSSQVFRSWNDISGFYPHRVMLHNAVASITRRAAAPLRFRFLKFPGILTFRHISLFLLDQCMSRGRLSILTFKENTGRLQILNNSWHMH